MKRGTTPHRRHIYPIDTVKACSTARPFAWQPECLSRVAIHSSESIPLRGSETRLLRADLDSTEPAPLGSRDLVCIFLLIATVGLVFYPVVEHRFLMYDDPLNVTENEYLRRPLEWRRVIRFWVGPYEGLYAPVAYTFYAAMVRGCELLGAIESDGTLRPWPFHVANLVMHGAAGVMVFLLLRRFFSSPVVALLAALAFALHPLQTESVSWVTELRGLLAGFWGLTALWQYVVFVQDASGNHARRRLHYLCATACFAIAILSKPSAAAVPLMTAVVGMGLLQRPWKRVLLDVTPWIVVGAAVAMASKAQQGTANMAFEIPWLPRPWIALDAVGFYLQKLVVPIELCADYGRDPLWVIDQGMFLHAGLAVLAIACAAALPNRRMWLAALGLFLAGILPTLGLVSFSFQSHSTVADRFAYLAMLGPSFAAALLLTKVSPRIAMVIAVPVLTLFGFLAHRQTYTWRNDEVMLTHTLSVSPTSMLALNNLGILMHERGDFAAAEELFRESIENDSAFYQPHNGLGQALVKQGRLLEAIEEFKIALQMVPGELSILNNLAQAELAAGFSARAAIRFEQILDVHFGYADVHVHLARAYENLNQVDLAREHYRFALEIEPTNREAAQALSSLDQATQSVAEPE